MKGNKVKEGHGVDTRLLCNILVSQPALLLWTEEVQVQIHAESKYSKFLVILVRPIRIK
jgi:hypothetical protein